MIPLLFQHGVISKTQKVEGQTQKVDSLCGANPFDASLKSPLDAIGFSFFQALLQASYFSSNETWTDDDFYLIFLSMLFYFPRISPHIFASHLKHTPAKKRL